MLDKRAWLTVTVLISMVLIVIDIRALCEPVRTYPTMSLWTLLCELEHIHAGTEKGFPKNCYGKVRSIEMSKMFWEADI